MVARAKSASVKVLAASPPMSSCRRSVDGVVWMAMGRQKISEVDDSDERDERDERDEQDEQDEQDERRALKCRPPMLMARHRWEA